MSSGFIDYSRRRRPSGAADSASNKSNSANHANQQEADPFSDSQQLRRPPPVPSESAAAFPDTSEADPDHAYAYQQPSTHGDEQRVAAAATTSAVLEDQPRFSNRSARPPRVEIMHTQNEEAAAILNDYTRRQQEEPYFDPSFPNYRDEQPLDMPFFDHVVADYGNYGFFNRLRVNFRQLVSFGLTTSALGLVLVLAYAHYLNPFKKSPPRAKADREYERRITGERGSSRTAYYAEFWGYRCDEHEIITEGGWILKAHRISDPRRAGGAPGYPVVLQHGILCNSAHFVLNEERSMAFWLVDQGFDVWVTNIRSNFDAGHTEYVRSDPRFWAWGLKELAFDLRDVVDFITAATGRPQLAYVGHSQGSGSMYLALSPGICPEIGNKVSCFVALGPSVYAGPVLRRFPFSLMQRFRSRKWWGFIFGVREFIPAIGMAQAFLPAFWFGHLAYVIFSYLFGFHDHNWLARHKPKIFRSVPISTSSELLYWYMAGFSMRGCIFNMNDQNPWFPRTFPPHSIFYGDIDYLVLGKPLVERIRKNETNVEMIHTVELRGYEHLDMIFGVDAYRTVFPGIKDTILSTLDPEQLPREMEERRRR
ncbi:alpha/beta-hydrolase [Violaceomyces palustris]|uniref:Alpha/beta-hydrolase n=1 Tax=Violaceomyces palustris TaxID=1673888 RepID=A0ACD0NLY3_9BASI|nr:alpha/beta-hydrolase [Violaceomyces palustris]